MRKYLPEKLAYAITRFKNVTGQQMIYGQSRTNPDRVRKELLGLAKQELPSEYVDEHFTPDYNPWDERLCLIPDNDLLIGQSVFVQWFVTDAGAAVGFAMSSALELVIGS